MARASVDLPLRFADQRERLAALDRE